MRDFWPGAVVVRGVKDKHFFGKGRKMKNLMTILTVAVALCLCGSIEAATLEVPGDYGTIQDAIDAAVYGDTVSVAAGTYIENITMKNGVAVIGAGASDTTIDGNDADSVVTAVGCDANTVLEGFTITNGEAVDGGGMCNLDGSSPTVTDCEFSGNWAGFGGGMSNRYNSSPTVSNCVFSGNTADFRGGGMCNWVDSSPEVTNCTFSGNSAEGYGGGMYNTFNSSATVTGCTFNGNNGSGMDNKESSPIVFNCRFTDNDGGGIVNYESNPTLTNCIFSGNLAGNSGGGMRNHYSSPSLTNCTFSGNSAEGYGGGMYNNNGSSPVATNCTFSRNSAGYHGGGIYSHEDSSPTVTNCILWGNTADWAAGPQLYIWGGTLSVSYCDVEGGEGAIYNNSGTINWGAGNIDEDPLFIDANGPDDIGGTEDDNLRLSAGSACIDAGDNGAVPADTTDLDGDGDTSEPIPWDLDGNPRIVDAGVDGIPIVDMGAYELWDSDGDGIEDTVDTVPTVYSDDFSDGATTSGTITSRGDQILTITDDPDPWGVRIKASPDGGTIPATVSVCGGEEILTLNAGDEGIVTCGSVETMVISGVIEITLVPVVGPPVTTSLGAGNSLTFEADTFTITAPLTNPDIVVLLINGDEFSLTPGETVILNLPPVANADGPYEALATGWDGAVVTLDGTGSYDLDGDIITYEWDLDLSFDSDSDGDPGNDVDATGATPEALFPIGQTGIGLVVVDECGARSEADMTSVTVSVIEVGVEIRTDDGNDTINVNSDGVVRVAFLTDLPEFDANTIDPMTMVLKGMSFAEGLAQMRGKNDSVPVAVDQDYDGDGDVDRVVNLDTERLTAEGLDAYCEIGALTYDGYVVLGVDIAHLAPVSEPNSP